MVFQSVRIVRPAIGLVQGVALYLLLRAAEAKAWPAGEGVLFSALYTTGVLVPIVLIAGLANLRIGTFVLWAVAAALVCGGVAAHDIIRDPVVADGATRLFPAAVTWAGLAWVLFISHTLVNAGDAERRAFAAYPRYFETAWQLALQLGLAALFTGVFWGLLWLGAELFELIQIRLLRDLIGHRWFWLPATTAVFALAFHISEVRANLVVGGRTLLLTLLAWLLPVMAALVLVFLLVLPLTGLEALWHTRHATSILLAAITALVILINAAFQDGATDQGTPQAIRVAEVVASVILLPLAALAGYGLMLRVGQYGWTPDRILAAACIAVASFHAAGYAFAVLRAPRTLRPIAATNVGAALLTVGVALALLSPLADPARISVADQLARLRAGKADPERFDYKFLRFDAGRYGKAALEALAANPPGPQPEVVAERARAALAATYSFQLLAKPAPVITAERRLANITVVFPAGRALPEGFTARNWQEAKEHRRASLPACLTAEAACNAVLVDLDGDGRDEILLFNPGGWRSTAFGQQADGAWAVLGPIANASCRGASDALKAGDFRLVTPALKQIEVAGQRLSVIEQPCP